MPELPEVETYVQELAPDLIGRQILAVDIAWERTVAAPTPADFAAQLLGRLFTGLGRRGKYLLLALDDGSTLVVHLRMTGELRVEPLTVELHKHTRFWLGLDDGRRLRFSDQRKFGRVWLVADVEQLLYRLGPEPLGNQFTVAGLAQALRGRRATVKALLLDQRIVVGVGNIYADEALFVAGVHPQRSGGDLSQQELVRLHAAIRQVLQAGIAGRGSSLQHYAPPSGVKGQFQEHHAVFRRTGLPCPRCGQPVQRVQVAQRSTHFCPYCQR